MKKKSPVPKNGSSKNNPYYADLTQQLKTEWAKYFDSAQLKLLRHLLHVLEQDYVKHGTIGHGYHCFEHSLELSLMILRSWRNFKAKLHDLSSRELLEVTLAAILHDYDPYSVRSAPRVERTLYVLKTDDLIKDTIIELKVNLNVVALYIERTNYPFNASMRVDWMERLKHYFPDKEARARFAFKAEKLALFDKGVTYFSLDPLEAQRRVEGLADEVNFSKNKLLVTTERFFKREKIHEVSRWVPADYRQRWQEVREHFQKISKKVSYFNHGIESVHWQN